MTLLIEYTGLYKEILFCKCIRIQYNIIIHQNLPDNFVPNGISYFSHQGELRPDPTRGPGSPRSRLGITIVIVFNEDDNEDEDEDDNE